MALSFEVYISESKGGRACALCAIAWICRCPTCTPTAPSDNTGSFVRQISINSLAMAKKNLNLAGTNSNEVHIKLLLNIGVLLLCLQNTCVKQSGSQLTRT